jgi:hypothetical protein
VPVAAVLAAVALWAAPLPAASVSSPPDAHATSHTTPATLQDHDVNARISRDPHHLFCEASGL